MLFYKSFHEVFMSIGLCDISLINVFLMLQFSLIWLGWWNKNLKLNKTKRLSKKLTRIHLNQMRFIAVSVWIGSFCSFSIWLVRFWTPLNWIRVFSCWGHLQSIHSFRCLLEKSIFLIRVLTFWLIFLRILFQVMYVSLLLQMLSYAFSVLMLWN
jgi:hypothetical protein